VVVRASKSDGDQLVASVAERYGSDIVRFLSRRVRNLADARDLAQEAYVRLLRLDRKDLIREPRPYLYRIAANVLYEFELKRRNESAGLTRWSDEQQGAETAGRVDGDVEVLALRARLEAVLDQLSPKCRAVLILHRRDGMTYDEIGQQVGISSGMVKKYLAQGLSHCRKNLQDFR